MYTTQAHTTLLRSLTVNLTLSLCALTVSALDVTVNLASQLMSPPATSSPLAGLINSSEASAEVRRTTTRTTTRTRRRRVVRRRRASHRASRRTYASNHRPTRRSRHNRRRYSPPPRRHSGTRVYHRPSAPSTSRLGARPLFEVGSVVFMPANPLNNEAHTALSLAGGYRFAQLGLMLEGQLSQGEQGGALHDLNAQLRAYLPSGNAFEIFPLLAFGRSELFTAEQGSHLDVGVGAQLKLGSHLALGARYQARVIAEGVGQGNANGHQLSAQLAFLF